MTCVATIVVPLLRQVDEWLEEAVRSALTQSVPTEVIVVRSSSTPASNLEILDRLGHSHSNLQVITEDLPGSFPSALNKGIRSASTDRVGFLLSDDWLASTAVAESIRETADIVSSGNIVYFPDGTVNEAAIKRASWKDFLACDTLEKKANYLEHFFLFQKRALLAVGGVDETLGSSPGLDDFDLIWTLLERGASVAIVDSPLYHYRDHCGERLSLQNPKQMRETLQRILRKHGVPEGNAEEIISRHAPWYGRPIYQVMADIKPKTTLSRSTALDVSLDAIMEYARERGLTRFAADGEHADEYLIARGDQVSTYQRTGKTVRSVSDAKGRARIAPPFRIFGDIVVTKPAHLTSIFWCLDLLKSGYAFAHIPTPLGPERVALLRQLRDNVLQKCRIQARPRPLPTTIRELIRFRQPTYRAEPERILMFTSTYNRGGSEKQMIATAEGLIGHGFDVHIVALGSLSASAPSVEAEIRALGIVPLKGADFTSPQSAGFRSAPESVIATRAGLPPIFRDRIGSVLAAIREMRPSVVHGWLDVPGLTSAIAACRLGVPRIVIGLRNAPEIMKAARYPSDIVDFLREGLREVSSNPSATVLSNSSAGAVGYEDWLGLPRGTIRVIRNGYKSRSVAAPTEDSIAGYRAQFGWSRDVPVVGTVMRFVEQKDPDLWLATAAEIAKATPDVRFLLAGYGELQPRLSDRVKSLGLSDRLAMSGPPADVGLALASLDVVLLTSLSEGTPNALIEAQVLGRPVVATDVGGVREVVLDGNTAIVIRERSARLLADAVMEILGDPAWATRARELGPPHIATHFDNDRMIRETLELYGAIGKASASAVKSE
jgi:glycosyltransferase involved in cell wall biosynthesis